MNNGEYLQNQNDPTTKANYTCNTVYNGSNTPTGGTYLASSCNARVLPGGSCSAPVANGAQFDTTTPGAHTFTATVSDSAKNTAS